MKPPRTVRVGPHIYSVTTEQRHSDDYGETQIDRCEIRLAAKQGPSQRRETFLHECMHGTTSLAGLRVEWGEDRDESCVTRLAPILLDFLRRNPRAVEFLVEP